jgi:hypothetical protein
MRTANEARSRPGARTPPTIRSTLVGTRNASATHPHDCEKYAPELAFAATTIAASAPPTRAVLRDLVIVAAALPTL